MYKVIIVEKTDDDKIVIDKDTLQALVDEAYQEGYEKGRYDHPYIPPYITWTPSTPQPLYWTTTANDNVPYTYTTITCSTENGIR